MEENGKFGQLVSYLVSENRMDSHRMYHIVSLSRMGYSYTVPLLVPGRYGTHAMLASYPYSWSDPVRSGGFGGALSMSLSVIG